MKAVQQIMHFMVHVQLFWCNNIVYIILLFSRTVEIETIVRGQGGMQRLIHFVCQKEIATVRWISLLS